MKFLQIQLMTILVCLVVKRSIKLTTGRSMSQVHVQKRSMMRRRIIQLIWKEEVYVSLGHIPIEPFFHDIYRKY